MTHLAIPKTKSIPGLDFSEVIRVDISQFQGAGDYISLSLPAFPRTKLDITQTYIDFTSHPQGDFGAGPTDSIAFSQASPALPASDGDTEMRIPISLLKTIDKTALTGVRFRIYATSKCTFRCLSIRACAQSWKYAPIDLDTLWNRVHKPPPPNGAVAKASEFPSNGFTGVYYGALMDGDVGILEGTGERGDAPYTASTWNIFESHAGRSPSIVHFSDPTTSAPLKWDGFGAGASANVGARGAIPMKSIGGNLTFLNEVAEGKQDTKIKEWAEGAKAYGKPVFVRLWWEANGTWWSFGRAANYVTAWRRFYEKVNAVTSNVSFFYCPNVIFDTETENYLVSMYPGDAYVDWVGMDGYSGQNPYKKEGTKNPREVFEKTYNKLREIAPSKPVMIGETSTSEFGTNKPKWIKELYELPRILPQLKAIVWYNEYAEHTSEAGTGRVDWPIESSTASTEAFKAAVASSQYIGAGQTFGYEKPPVPEQYEPANSWPIVFRSNDLAGVSDPQPINIEIGALFTAGSLTQAQGSNYNELALYFRDLPMDDQTMVELNSYNQGAIESFGKQPTYGTALYISRDQEDLDIQKQFEIDNTTQFAIEREPDRSEHSWIEVRLKWNESQTNNALTIKNADGTGYTFKNIEITKSNAANLNSGNYIVIVSLVGSTCRVRIYPVDQVGTIEEGSITFDSGLLVDDKLFKRRKGRVGWWASFADGDAYLHSVKTRGTNFGEVITKEFKSITPVKGVSLFSGSTEDAELVTGVERTSPDYMSISLDPAASATGKALKVTSTPQRPLQGLATNPFYVDDPDNLKISFDLKFPSSEVPGGGISAFLFGSYEQVIPLNLSAFTRDTWSHVKVSLAEGKVFQTGQYQFVLMQSLPIVSTNWWIENLSVKTTSVRWSARSHANDPWSNPEERWQEVGFTLNTLQGGVVFNEIGNGLQIRGQALRQDAMIHDYKAIPQYATLGRMSWPETSSGQGSAPSTPTITTSTNGRTVTFTGSATDTDGSIVSYYWAFGDDAYDSGPQVQHTYVKPGEGPRYEYQVLSDEPLLYWRLDETSGTTAADSSGNNRKGEYLKEVTLGVTGALKGDSNKGIATTNSKGSYVKSTYNPFSGTKTFEIWANRSTNTSTDVLFGGTTAGTDGMYAYANSGNNNLRLTLNGFGITATWTNALPGLEVWSHIVYIINATTLKATVYVNGVTKGEQTISAYGSPGNLRVSHDNVVGALTEGCWSGSLDEFAVYEGALSATRIKAHYEAGIYGREKFLATLVAKDNYGNTSSAQKIVSL